jgi:hypothetical protein
MGAVVIATISCVSTVPKEIRVDLAWSCFDALLSVQSCTQWMLTTFHCNSSKSTLLPLIKPHNAGCTIFLCTGAPNRKTNGGPFGLSLSRTGFRQRQFPPRLPASNRATYCTSTKAPTEPLTGPHTDPPTSFPTDPPPNSPSGTALVDAFVAGARCFPSCVCIYVIDAIILIMIIKVVLIQYVFPTKTLRRKKEGLCE